MLACSGLILFIRPLVRILFGTTDALDVAHLVVGTILLIAGFFLIWRDSPTLGVAWKTLWTQTLHSRKDKVAFALILLGAQALPILVTYLWSPESAEASLLFLVVALPALVIGWLLALSEFLPSRSPDK
jgi:hypothetical protein